MSGFYSPRAAAVPLLLCALLLSACGGDDDAPPAAPEIVHAIEARKASYKEIGGAFKTISDELKHERPDLNGIGPMAREILVRGRDQLQYFPEGSGPESRQKTRAKAEIWTDFAGFTQAQERFIASAQQLVDAMASGADVAALVQKQRALGESCKNCHDRFRLPDE